ncbi:MAG: hypothetical protein IMF05_11840 [Proteobacteria bacterium]|nr:hypothetical protein [Pseudomonadota bacterium]
MKRLSLKTGFLILLAVGVVYFVGMWLIEGFILRDPYSDSPLKTKMLGPSYYYRFTFNGMFDGKPLSVNRLVECRPFAASGGIGAGTHLIFQRVPEFTGKRLDNGAAVYFMVPNFCLRNLRSGQWLVSETTEVAPFGFWIDSLENPTVIEAYASVAYYEDPDARLTMDVGQVEFLEAGFAPQEQMEPAIKVPAPWSRWHSSMGQRPPPWRGWQLVPADDSLRDALSQARPIEGTPGQFELYHLKPGIRVKYDNGAGRGRYQTRIKGGTPLNLPAVLMRQKSPNNAEQGARLLGRMIPFRWAGDGRYEATTKPRGYAIWQPGNELYTTLDHGTHATFVLNGQEFSVDFAGSHARKIAFLNTETSEVFFLQQW